MSRPTRLLINFAAVWLLLLNSAFAQKSTPGSNAYVGAVEPTTATEVYGQGVRETAWQTVDSQAAGFHLPPGFTINAFASEPMIAKPLNMAWDEQGRLWITSTVEYPYPAKAPARARDQVLILEDTDVDGRADKSTVFADGLNIPMGILPMHDGAIVFSIPNLVYLRDTDGDDQADEEEILLGPFDTTRDTHGMINSFRRGSDGWIYACHGFNNRSTISDRSGHQIQMHSGNTFRFTPDGKHVQLYSQGQVNPFGLTQDEWGNWYSADCHSKPITALLRGGCYPSFGRPHDGLGFAPEMMKHLHGSTAISGLSYYQAGVSQSSRFPAAYHRKFYSGNVMTSRINCNALLREGANSIAVEQTDFLTSDDPWFRPVDIQVGPDGAMYVADFYNKIIGHYEVPLAHPGRDRVSGRIWRIAFDGQVGASEKPPIVQPTQPIHELLQGGDNYSVARALRLEANRPPSAVRSGMGEFLPSAASLLSSGEPQVVLAAIEFLGRYGDSPSVLNLLDFSAACDDVTLVHAARIAARDLMRDERILKVVQQFVLSGESASRSHRLRAFIAVLPALKSETAARSLLQYAASLQEGDLDLLRSALDLVEQFPASVDATTWQLVVESLCGSDRQQKIGFLSRLITRSKAIGGLAQQHTQVLQEYRDQVLAESTRELIGEIDRDGPPQTWIGSDGTQWPVQDRRRTDGETISLWSSFPLGERYVGSWTSEPFTCPAQLSFWIAGHNGLPREAGHQNSFIRLVDASGGELRRATPPRSDLAHQVHWELAAQAGQKTRLEVVDGDRANSYAWLAVGQFSAMGLNPSGARAGLEEIIALLAVQMNSPVAANQIEEVRDHVLMGLDGNQQGQLLAAILQMQQQSVASTLVQFSTENELSDLLPPTWLNLDAISPKNVEAFASRVFRSVDALSQRELSSRLLKSADGCKLLAGLLDRGWIGSVALGSEPDLFPAGLTPDQLGQLKRAFTSGADAEAMRAAAGERFARLTTSELDVGVGKLVFEKHCASCHQLEGKGALVGPQLDGAMKRSKQRLAEDILAPNLNVDSAFRTTSLLMDDDSVVAGLVTSESDKTIALVKSDGKPVEVQKSAVVQRKQSLASLMPVGLADQMSDEHLAALLEFLTTHHSQ